MTETIQPSSATEIDPAALYRVTLIEAISVGRRLVAGHNVRLKGRVLAETLATRPSAIAAFELVQ
jgi:hypothetical protein